MVNYLYSELQRAIEKVRYEGLASQTAAVIINQDDNTIQVNVTQIPAELLEPHIDKGQADGKHLLVGVLSSGVVNYSWVNIEDFLASLEHQNEELNERITQEATRTDNMINQLNENVNQSIADLNNNLVQAINTINGGIEEERQTRATADSQLQSNIDTEVNDRKAAISAEETRTNNMIDQLNQNVSGQLSQLNQNLVDAINTINGGIAEEVSARKQVDQHLWDILPDNIIAGTPMQGLENANAINIVFSKYQKHGIGEDPAEGEFVEVPNQAITLFPATQEVAGVLTAADKTKIDNIATDIESAVQAEAEARQEADTTLESKLDSLIVVEGDAIQVGREDKELNIKTGGRFTVNSNYEVVTSEEYPGEPGRRIIPLENNDQIAGKKTDGNGVPLIFVSKWDKVEVGGKGAPLNLNSNDGKVTVNDEHTLLDETDKSQIEEDITTSVSAEQARAKTAEQQLQTDLNNEVQRATAAESTLQSAVSSEAEARQEADTTLESKLDTVSSDLQALDNIAVKLTGQNSQSIQGNVTIQGNLLVNGTTTTNDTESLTVKDNIIVTNSGGVTLNNLSGLFIKTGTTTGYAVVYDPTTNTVILGEGTIDGSNEVTVVAEERKAIVTRPDNDSALITGNLTYWDSSTRGITTSNIAVDEVVIQPELRSQVDNLNDAINTKQNSTDNTLETTSKTVVGAINEVDEEISAHINNTNNPHAVTKAQLGIENVDNTSDRNKPVSTATRIALDSLQKTLENTISSTTDALRSEIENELKIEVEYLNSSISTVSTALTKHEANTANPHSVTAEQIGLGNVDNTSDLDKPISNAVQSALNNKVTVEAGKGLSTNDFTTADKEKLDGIPDLPLVTASDNGKFLSVQDGQYTLTTLSFNINDDGELILTYSY